MNWMSKLEMIRKLDKDSCLLYYASIYNHHADNEKKMENNGELMYIYNQRYDV